MAYTQEQMLEIRKRVFEGYGVSSGSELEALPVFQEAIKQKGSRTEAFNAILKRRESGSLRGRFLHNDEFGEWQDDPDKPGKKMRVIKDRGPTVLLPDGAVQTFWTGEALDARPMTPVEITDMVRIHNYEKGTTGRWQKTDDTKVHLSQNGIDEPVPVVHVGDAVHKLFERRKDFGTIYGETPEWNWITASLQLGSDEEIFFNPPKKEGDNPYLAATAYPLDNDDPANETDADKVPRPVGMPDYKSPMPIRIVLPPAYVQQLLGLDDASDPTEYKAELQGEEVFVYGPLRVTDRRTRDFFEKDNLGVQFDTVLEEAMTYMDQYRTTTDGTPLRRLNLTRAMQEEGQGLINGIQIGKHRVLDIVEEKPGQIVMQCLSDSPTIDVNTVEYEIKNGPRAGGTFVKNEGAFVAFLNRFDVGSETAPAIKESDLDFFLGGPDAQATTPAATQ